MSLSAFFINAPCWESFTAYFAVGMGAGVHTAGDQHSINTTTLLVFVVICLERRYAAETYDYHTERAASAVKPFFADNNATCVRCVCSARGCAVNIVLCCLRVCPVFVVCVYLLDVLVGKSVLCLRFRVFVLANGIPCRGDTSLCTVRFIFFGDGDQKHRFNPFVCRADLEASDPDVCQPGAICAFVNFLAKRVDYRRAVHVYLHCGCFDSEG